MDPTSRPADASAVVIGVDYGTLSGRAVVVRVSDGVELGSAVHAYSHAVLERALPSGRVLPPDWALQVPSDYVDVLRNAVPAALTASGVSADQVIGLGTDFTACTVLPTLTDGTPLCELPEFAEEPHAYVKLWKHHAAQSHADRINAAAHEQQVPWINRYGGKLSAEWALAKGLELFEDAPAVYARTEHFIEAADWIVWQLTGEYVRNACTTGYKAAWQDGQYPSEAFLESVSPGFGGFIREKVEHPVRALGELAGRLTAQAAEWTGLPEGIAICVGNVDAHVTAAAARALEPGQMVAIMGTSTCHVMNSDQLGEIPGMCGVVDGGIIQGLWGYEAGQSGVGDIFGWFIDSGVPESYRQEAESRGLGMHEYLTELAADQAVGQTGLVALDWHNGNRSVLVDHTLSAVIVGQTLATRPEEVYRALLEATAFGTRTIVEAFESNGVPVTELIVAGGLLKNALLMQIYSDVTRLPLSVIGSEQGPALGSAIHAAVAAGAYPDVRSASAAMGRVERNAYQPDQERAKIYDAIFAEYSQLHDYFGRGGNDVMHRLRDLRREALR
jgi:L-ribulokinase